MTCSACKASDHPRAAHYDPALARVMAQLCDVNRDHKVAAMWRWIASNLERRTQA
jgi:hypothetical protein